VRWDQRAAQGVVQDMSSPTVSYAGGKDYARGTNFSCMATSGKLQPVVFGDCHVGCQSYQVQTSSCVTSAQACHGAAGDGYVVVGSEDGRVRLYSSNTLTMAKTAIPGLGAPITNVDVTYDGKWVLATTDKYVMVVKTTFRDKNGRYVSLQCTLPQSSYDNARNTLHICLAHAVQGDEWFLGSHGTGVASTQAAAVET